MKFEVLYLKLFKMQKMEDFMMDFNISEKKWKTDKELKQI